MMYIILRPGRVREEDPHHPVREQGGPAGGPAGRGQEVSTWHCKPALGKYFCIDHM